MQVICQNSLLHALISPTSQELPSINLPSLERMSHLQQLLFLVIVFCIAVSVIVNIAEARPQVADLWYPGSSLPLMVSQRTECTISMA